VRYQDGGVAEGLKADETVVVEGQLDEWETAGASVNHYLTK